MARKKALEQFHMEGISRAADRLFLQKGVAGTTVDEIAREAGYSKATLYVYFQSKEEIFHYIVLKSMDELLRLMELALGRRQNPLDQYWEVCRELTAFSDEHPFYFECVLETVECDPSVRTPILEEIYLRGEELNGIIQRLMENGVRQGVFRDLPCLPAGFVLWASISGVIRIAHKKEAYIRRRMGLEKSEMQELGFKILLRSIVKEGVELG